MKAEGTLKIDGNEGMFLYSILAEKYSLIRNQRSSLIRKRFELIKKILIIDRTIEKGDQPAFFGLVTQTVDKYITKNKTLYKEMIEVEDIIRHNEYELENLYVVLINKIQDEIDFHPVKIEYEPIEATSDYKHVRKYTLLMLDYPEDTPDEEYLRIVKRYSPFHFR